MKRAVLFVSPSIYKESLELLRARGIAVVGIAPRHPPSGNHRLIIEGDALPDECAHETPEVIVECTTEEFLGERRCRISTIRVTA